ncbi:carboxypeptidase B-like [Choristoneura fumiferana]|uniref:carboxypeptidase B-like n=2 Tax=Choristoneura fumiferana TaxID=7141 RepID=UPI003D155B96
MQEDYFCHHEAEENVHQPLPSLSKAFYVFTDQNPEPGYEKYTHNPHTCHYLVDHGHNHNHNHEHHHDHIEESQKSVAHVMDDNLSRVSKLGSCGRYSGVKSRYMDHFKKIYDLKEKKYGVKEMDWKAYHRLDVIHNFLDGLEADYPSLCTAGVIGSSLEGRDLKVLKISNSAASNASVWMDAGIHAREWIAPAVATYIANHFARNFKDLPTSITNKDWYFLPVMNPDGYEFSHTDNRMWRKNRAWHGGKCIGVDLNRNFSYGWGLKGSSDEPSNAFYRGPEPFSEPESSAVRDILGDSGIEFKVYITLHSYGQVILFPYAFREELAPDYVNLLEGATIMSKAIYETSGNTYKVGISRDVMYGASGTSNDWSYGAAKIPFCYLLELRSKKHRFKVPQEEIEETGNEILKGVMALMEFVDTIPIRQSSKESARRVSSSSD